MKLLTLKKRVDRLVRLAEEQGVNPEVMLGVLPRFPEACTVLRVTSSLEDAWKLGEDDEHEVYIAEQKDLGFMKPGVADACWKDSDDV